MKLLFLGCGSVNMKILEYIFFLVTIWNLQILSLTNLDYYLLFHLKIVNPFKLFVVFSHIDHFLDDYSQASRAATKACYKSDIESTEYDENNPISISSSSKGRRIVRNKRYLNSQDQESSDSDAGSCASSLRSMPSIPLGGT